MTDIIGGNVGDRLCIWTRTGDVTGDGVADIVVAADQEESHGISDSGVVYVIRGGTHLGAGLTVDLASFGSTAIVGHIARFMPSATPTPNNSHTGATCQIGDLDGNGRAEVMAASALNRAGAGLFGEATGGSPDGTLYTAWDDSFPGGTWPAGYSFDISASPGARTITDGENVNVEFGEEILGGSTTMTMATPNSSSVISSATRVGRTCRFLASITCFTTPLDCVGWNSICRRRRPA